MTIINDSYRRSSNPLNKQIGGKSYEISSNCGFIDLWIQIDSLLANTLSSRRISPADCESVSFQKILDRPRRLQLIFETKEKLSRVLKGREWRSTPSSSLIIRREAEELSLQADTHSCVIFQALLGRRKTFKSPRHLKQWRSRSTLSFNHTTRI